MSNVLGMVPHTLDWVLNVSLSHLRMAVCTWRARISGLPPSCARPVHGLCTRAVKPAWESKLEGKYIMEQHGSTNECYSTLEEAKTKCEQASDCHGIATQSNVCNGKYRITHGITATLVHYNDWKSINLWAYTVDRGGTVCPLSPAFFMYVAHIPLSPAAPCIPVLGHHHAMDTSAWSPYWHGYYCLGTIMQ